MRLAIEDEGEGLPVVLLHGLTATRRYVVMGSKALRKAGHRVVAYDARGHGESEPAPSPDAYGYECLAADLIDVLDDRGVERAVLAGASMGAHTAIRLALEEPDLVAGLVLITPAFHPDHPPDLDRWDRLSDALRSGGVDGFVEAYGEAEHLDERYRETVLRVVRQRLGRHEHPEAVADALRCVPRSKPFDSLDALEGIAAPTVVVPSRDDADPGHPYAIGDEYARRIPGADVRVEDEGSSPLAWQGGRLSKVIAELAGRVAA
ncbi:MAG TPA: alpha/beta hydrolase [Solirubrobacteraceae bacterium]|nr:alpha/beta hydrolase [Solirubrobacteraceae bacterium]